MSDSKTEVYMLAYGFIQGFYHTENYPVKTGCTRCAEFALPLANAQAGFIRLLNFFLLYVKKNSYEDIPDFTGRLIMLYDSYIVFWGAIIHLHYWIQSDTAKVLWKMLIATTSEDFKGVF